MKLLYVLVILILGDFWFSLESRYVICVIYWVGLGILKDYLF